jgi:hypothetical protein
MNHPKSKFGRRYDEAFKRQTVELMQSQQRPRRQREPRAGRFGMEPFTLVPAVRPAGGGRGAAGGWKPAPSQSTTWMASGSRAASWCKKAWLISNVAVGQ